MKRSRQVANASASDTVVCGKKFKARGIKQHQSKCSNKKRRQLASAFDGLDLKASSAFLETNLCKATEAKKLYGVEDIDGVPHERISEHSRENRRLKYEDMQRHVEMMFGSKMAWLEMLAVKKNRSRKLMATKKRKKDEYKALLATFPKEFAQIIQSKFYSRKSAVELQEGVARYYAMVAALNAYGLTLQDDLRCSLCIAYGTSQPESWWIPSFKNVTS